MSILPSPFRFEAKLSAEAFEKLGRLSLRWSHIDHMIANCLKRTWTYPWRARGTGQRSGERKLVEWVISLDHALGVVVSVVGLAPQS